MEGSVVGSKRALGGLLGLCGAASVLHRPSYARGVRRKWPIQIEDAIERGLALGDAPTAIYRGIRSGELHGLERPYPMPERTFWQTLARVRKKIEARKGPRGDLALLKAASERHQEWQRRERKAAKARMSGGVSGLVARTPPERRAQRIAGKAREPEELTPRIAEPSPSTSNEDDVLCPGCGHNVAFGTGRCPDCGTPRLPAPETPEPLPLARPQPVLTPQEEATGYRRGGWPL
jgi:hypothetical protein